MQEALYITNWCIISDRTVILKNKKETVEENFTNFAAFIKHLYKKEKISYPKFYKMDNLSKLGFLGAELLLAGSDVLTKYGSEEIGVIMANSSSSLDTDIDYQELIRDKSNYFPSPAVFVYTLPNILIGEICIRHRIIGENAFFISEEFNPEQLVPYVEHLFEQGIMKACICGWVEFFKEKYHLLMLTVEHLEEGGNDTVPRFNEEHIYKLYKNM